MPLTRPFAALLMSLVGIAPLAVPTMAQTVRTEAIDPATAMAGGQVEGQIVGEETVVYLVDGMAGQTLSVDLSTTNASLFFNILPPGQSEALFNASVDGTVADLPLPADGTYAVELYLMRNAARRNETARFTLGIGLAGGDFADGLAGGPDWWQVTGLTSEALNIRSGPDTRYAVVGKARNGDVMQNRGCRMTGPLRWCSIRVDGSGVQGWVAGSYLTETAAPAQPAIPEGGPVGNGTGFDATGLLPCVTAAGAAPRDCPFGVVRDGPGNAGVWIAIGGGIERQVLFEGGVPVAAAAPAEMQVEKVGDIFTIILGAERYTIPEAVITGG